MVKYQLIDFGQSHLRVVKKLAMTSDEALKKV